MFCDQSQYLWSILLHQMGRLYAGRFLGELDKALGRPGFSALCICTLADLMQTSKQARKAPKLTGKLLLLGRNQPQWQAA